MLSRLLQQRLRHLRINPILIILSRLKSRSSRVNKRWPLRRWWRNVRLLWIKSAQWSQNRRNRNKNSGICNLNSETSRSCSSISNQWSIPRLIKHPLSVTNQRYRMDGQNRWILWISTHHQANQPILSNDCTNYILKWVYCSIIFWNEYIVLKL